MLSKRIIACLDVRDGKVVKGVNFEGLRDAGDPAALARRYNVEGIDEVVILDVTATIESAPGARAHHRGRGARDLSAARGRRRHSNRRRCGGGDRGRRRQGQPEHRGARAIPDLITTLAKRYGSQAVIVAIDAKRQDDRFAVFARSGQAGTTRDAVEWAREATDRGAGEILLTSIDRDGTKAGFDCEMTAAVSDAVNIPVIASGGAGTFEHFAEVFGAGHADAALAASIFHFNEKSVRELKEFLAKRQIPVRL